MADAPRRAGPLRRRNDPAQYEQLAGEWWSERGAFEALRWIAAARRRHLPPAPAGGGLLLDVACGGGLLAPELAGSGYQHVGIDRSASAAAAAAEHGVLAARADAGRLPFRDAAFHVVVAGEVLEHVLDLPAALAESCRVLRPGGTLIIDTIADTRWARFAAVTVAERLPAGPPPLLHDPALFVDRAALRRLAAEHGVGLQLVGLRPSGRDYLAWLLRRRDAVRMVPTRFTGALFQAVGRKAA
jgi:2-polyprenyl-6-hydroxyphenyl methylase/3-demethylubiquinone-9 3-methyltransferase